MKIKAQIDARQYLYLQVISWRKSLYMLTGFIFSNMYGIFLALVHVISTSQTWRNDF